MNQAVRAGRGEIDEGGINDSDSDGDSDDENNNKGEEDEKEVEVEVEVNNPAATEDEYSDEDLHRRRRRRLEQKTKAKEPRKSNRKNAGTHLWRTSCTADGGRAAWTGRYKYAAAHGDRQSALD